ncbi:MAG: hypothetical protein B6D41_17600 [Chloroflexi bacterium UTCFX4]|jgi:hypothetical protein|nr:MAG: hypothetical protein B6D41_17600 [Chloroflexi bacterium UTCFX4]
MTETRFTWRWLLVIALVGIGMGLTLGLLAGWLVFPNIGGSNVSGLSVTAQSDYIVLVANTYAYDQDLTRAKQRLNLLHDQDITTRLERLAKSLAARKDASAANVADLAVALGSEDSSLQVMAANVGGDTTDDPANVEPTKIARSDADAQGIEPTPTEQAAVEPTVKPTKQRKNKATATPAEPQATAAPEEPTAPPATKAPKSTAEPTATPAPVAAPVTTEFTPPYPAGWWNAIKFIPAQVSPGQQYFHLKYARYCDWAPNDNYETCPGFPAGGMGHSIYIMVVDENGNCITTDVNDILNDGSKHPLTPDMLKKIEFPWNPYGYACDKDYEKEMYGEGNDISVPGLPSDTITQLQLCATNPPAGLNPPPCGRAHVRYFLIFQRTTR